MIDDDCRARTSARVTFALFAAWRETIIRLLARIDGQAAPDRRRDLACPHGTERLLKFCAVRSKSLRPAF